MRYIEAHSLIGTALLLVASCSATTRTLPTTPTQEHAAAQPAVARPAAIAPMQRDLYTAKLVYLLRHGWRPPTDLQTPPMSLKTTAEIGIDAHGAFVSYRLAKSSGSVPFDNSVTDHVRALIAAGTRAESGPPYIVDRIFGETLTVRFTGPPPPGTPPY